MIDRQRLERIVAEAADMAMGKWPGAGHELKSWEKTPGSPVCEADLAVDRFLRRELGALLPAAGWLSEETADNAGRLDCDLIWLVDPIDGTRDFIRGRTGWAVSVALISAGRPLIGVLAAPARDEFWCATAGQGATRNGRPLKASTRTEFAGARVPADSLAREDQDLTMVDKPNSIALRVAMVGAAEADLVATLRWGFEWDVRSAPNGSRADAKERAGPSRNRPSPLAVDGVGGVQLPLAACTSAWLTGVMRISTRRLSARPVSVALSATGYCSP